MRGKSSRDLDYVAFSASSGATVGTPTSAPFFAVTTTTLDIPLNYYQATFYYMDTSASENYGGGAGPLISLSVPGASAVHRHPGGFDHARRDLSDRPSPLGAGQTLPASGQPPPQVWDLEVRDFYGNPSPGDREHGN